MDYKKSELKQQACCSTAMDDHEVNEELKKLHQAEFFNAQYYCS
jgi:hypothetical protein